MEILVCVKQVPDTAEVKIDPVKHTVIRAGVPNIFNPFDQNALEAALQLKDNQGAKVTLLSMNEAYKVQLIEDLPEDAQISLYRQGDYVDLCAGPHGEAAGGA